MKCGILDKVFTENMAASVLAEVMPCSDEAEAIAIAAGYYVATGKIGKVFISADGFMNALNFLTSWIIPEKIPMHIYISIGRTEPSHIISTEITELIINLLEKYDPKGISYMFVRRK